MAIEEYYRCFAKAPDRHAFAGLMEKFGFTRFDAWGGGAENYEEVWAPADKASAVNYVEDVIAQLPYLCIRQQSGGLLLDALTEHVKLETPEELIAFAKTDPPNNVLVETLYKIAITFPEYDAAAANILGGAAARHPLRTVRGAALEAIAYRAWPLMRPAVEALSASADDAGLRDHAREILGRWPA